MSEEILNEPIKKNKKKISRKFILIIIVILIVIICFLLSGKKVNGGFIFQRDDALSLGEKKYLSFLWMVDGAFNDQRYNEEIIINDKKINDIYKKFTCDYDASNKTCIGNNFEEEFKNLFASKITYDKVYGDNQSFFWYKKVDNKYQFTNMNTCSISRMSLNQKIEVKEEEIDKITYVITFSDNVTSSIYKGNHLFKKDFVLIKEDGDWKVSEAYYHDPCFMDYYIE